MPHFQYKGRNKHGELIEGELEASTKVTVATHLSRLEITPISIQSTAKLIRMSELPKWFVWARPKDTDLSMFAKQMHRLLKSSVPINHALKVVIDSNKSHNLRNALTRVLIDLESGYTIARCFQNQGYVFPAFFTAMIDVGEQTGKLDTMFEQIHRYLETEIITKKRIQSAMRYPTIVFAAIVAALAMMNFFVIPAFKSFFDSMQAQLPWATQWLIAISNFCMNYGWAIGLGVMLVLIAYPICMTKQAIRLRWDQVKLRLPWVGSLLHRAMMARFTRSLAMAYQSGLPLVDAILVVAKSTDNVYITQELRSLTNAIEKGESFAVVAKKSHLFSPITVQMIAVAEETGQISENLVQVAEFYEQDVDFDIKKMNDLLEPILILIIALMVLVLALGVFLPLWDLSSVAMQKIRS